MSNRIDLPHLISIKQLNRDTIDLILTTATELQATILAKKAISSALQGKVIANLFFEPSTRTCNSFTIAAKRLSALTITPHLPSSSILKGESLLDTVRSLAAMGVDAFIIRHAENGILSWLAENLNAPTHIISAGEVWTQHPSQALLDLFTISQYKSHWRSLSVAIVGDLRHSRVSRSLIDALTLMGVEDIRLVCPDVLAPETDVYATTRVFNTLAEGIHKVDVIVCLRLQKERMQQEHFINEIEFHQQFGITADKLKGAKPDVIVMHPGPMNRNIEISSEVADGPHAVILKQIYNGVAIRMALLKLLLS